MSGQLEAIFAALLTTLARTDSSTWLVGGALRDALLGMPSVDVDLATTADPMMLAGALRDTFGATIATMPRSVRVAVAPSDGAGALQLDIAPLRGARIEDDLRERDYTVNALALPIQSWAEALLPARDGAPALPPDLVDPLGGREDLARRRLRATGPYAMQRDPGRIVRGARLIARHQLRADAQTIALAQDAAPLLGALPPDRLPFEMNLLLVTEGCADGLSFLAECGTLTWLLPMLTEPGPVAHALECVRLTTILQAPARANEDELQAFTADSPLIGWYVAPMPDGVARIASLRWGLLLHAGAPHEPPLVDTAPARPPTAASVARRLPSPARRVAYEIEARACFTARALAQHEPTDRDLWRLFDVAGDVTVDVLAVAAVCAVALAAKGECDVAEARGVVERAQRVVDLYFVDRARLMPPPLLAGRDVMVALGLAPGPEIGRLLADVRSAQLDGRVTTREEALTFARDTLAR